MQIVIAGPGRSGTSLLVRLFASFGFSTSGGAWHDDANAGLEAPFGGIAGGVRPEVTKDPWLFNYVNELPTGSEREVRRLIIPLRAREDAGISRMIRERGVLSISIMVNAFGSARKRRSGSQAA